MSMLNEVAGMVAQEFSADSGQPQTEHVSGVEAINPANLAIFVTLITNLITMIKGCAKPTPSPTPTPAPAAVALGHNNADAQKIINNPNLFQRMRLRTVVHSHMSPKDFRNSGTQMVKALQATGSRLTQVHVDGLMNEVD